MNELIDKVENLKRSLDESQEVQDLLRLNKEIMKDNGKTYFPLKDGDNIEYIEVKPKHSISKNR